MDFGLFWGKPSVSTVARQWIKYSGWSSVEIVALLAAIML